MRTPSATAALVVFLGAGLPAFGQQDHDHRGGQQDHDHGGGSPPHGPRGGEARGQPMPPAPPQSHSPGRQSGGERQPGGEMRGHPPPAPPRAPPPPGPGWRQPQRGPAGGGYAPPQPPPARREPARGYAPPQRAPAEARRWNENRGWRPEGAWGQHRSWQEHRSNQWQNDHRNWSQRGGYGGSYIPPERFQRRFGSEHPFHLQSRPVIENGYPRFRYGGYSFLIVDPWPGYWTDDWYRSDDIYVDYDDGYYLYDRRYPDVAIALTVMP